VIANFAVATGHVVHPSIGPTRTETDFAAHIARTIAADPAAGDVLLVDRLTTHQSASLVRLVAAVEGDAGDLGVKGESGIPASLASRAAFLSAPCRWIQFVDLPTHTSWLNQIEIWLSILVRRLLKRASFTSTDDLRAPILAFIAYVNQHAKPVRWTDTGRRLMA
jgi:transposase